MLIKAISRIEVHIRTSIIYYMSNKHKHNSTWFASKAIMSDSYVNNFQNTYDRIALTSYIRHHMITHTCKYAPAWKTIEFMTFGELILLYNAISNVTSKLEICKKFGIRSILIFDSYLKAIKHIRNKCAHNGLLYDYSTSLRIPNKGPVKLATPYDCHNLKGAIELIRYFLNRISINRGKEFDIELQKLIDDTKDNFILYNTISIASGLK